MKFAGFIMYGLFNILCKTLRNIVKTKKVMKKTVTLIVLCYLVRKADSFPKIKHQNCAIVSHKLFIVKSSNLQGVFNVS